MKVKVGAAIIFANFCQALSPPLPAAPSRHGVARCITQACTHTHTHADYFPIHFRAHCSPAEFRMIASSMSFSFFRKAINVRLRSYDAFRERERGQRAATRDGKFNRAQSMSSRQLCKITSLSVILNFLSMTSRALFFAAGENCHLSLIALTFVRRTLHFTELLNYCSNIHTRQNVYTGRSMSN